MKAWLNTIKMDLENGGLTPIGKGVARLCAFAVNASNNSQVAILKNIAPESVLDSLKRAIGSGSVLVLGAKNLLSRKAKEIDKSVVVSDAPTILATRREACLGIAILIGKVALLRLARLATFFNMFQVEALFSSIALSWKRKLGVCFAKAKTSTTKTASVMTTVHRTLNYGSRSSHQANESKSNSTVLHALAI